MDACSTAVVAGYSLSLATLRSLVNQLETLHVLHGQQDRGMHTYVTGLKQQCNQVCKSIIHRH